MTSEQPGGAGLAQGQGSPNPVEPPRLPRQRRRGMLALAVLLVCLGSLLAVYLVRSSTHRVPVVVMQRDVAVGTPITSADVGTAMVAVESGIHIIPGSQLSEIPGKIARTDLKQGTLLAAAQLSAVRAPSDGQQLVAVALSTSQIPARGLASGDKVLVVLTQGTQGTQGAQGASQQNQNQPANAGALPMEGVQATVDQVGKANVDQKVVVDLLVPAKSGPEIARQAAGGRIALNLLPRRP